MKKNDLLEGWSYPLKKEVFGLQLLDHTYVKAPNNGPAYFNCFGGHDGPGKHILAGASGKGNYAVANCYRNPIKTLLPDTAGLIPYGFRGVCHQAANRFLWSASGYIKGVTVHTAQGYVASFLMYGTYGRPLGYPPAPTPIKPSTFPPADFIAIYANCARKYGKVGAIDESESVTPKGFEQSIAALHHSLNAKGEDYDPNVVISEELRLLVEHKLGSKFVLAKIEEIRNTALSGAHKIATSDLRGESFANEINGIVAQLQDELEDHLGSENYSRLLDLPSKKRFALLDPAIAERDHDT